MVRRSESTDLKEQLAADLFNRREIGHSVSYRSKDQFSSQYVSEHGPSTMTDNRRDVLREVHSP